MTSTTEKKRQPPTNKKNKFCDPDATRRSSIAAISRYDTPNADSESSRSTYNHLCTFYDDESELYVAEIEQHQWQAFTDIHDFKLVESVDDDPMLELYLLESIEKDNSKNNNLPNMMLVSDFQQNYSVEEIKLMEEIAQLKVEVKLLSSYTYIHV